jgi:hypothetical protein
MRELPPIIRRIAEALGGQVEPGASIGHGVVSALVSGLSPRDLRSLFLYVMAERALAREPLSFLQDHARGGAVGWPSVDARALHALEGDAFDAADAFDAIDLPLVVPHGATYALSGVHPNNVLAAMRGFEVMGDPTIAFALEAALRRRDPYDRATVLRFAAVARVMRMQPTNVPGYRPHFKLFALATAGRERGALGFSMEAIVEHVATLLAFFARASKRGYVFGDLAVELSDTDVVASLLRARGVDPEMVREEIRAHELEGSAAFLVQHGLDLPRGRLDALRPSLAPLARPLRERVENLDENVLEVLTRRFPGIRFSFDLTRMEGLGYYAGPCIRISATDPAGVRFPLGDGGVLRWTGKLLTDDKERLVTSGVGLELIGARFGRVG